METTSHSKMHVGLNVSDIQKTVAFYTKFFETEPVKVKDDYAKFILSEPPLVISFIKKQQTDPVRFGHLGFQVESKEAVREKMKKLILEEVSVLDEGSTTCCYALQDKFWVTDPDGVRWEVYYVENDSEEFGRKSEVCCDDTTCCV